MIASLLVVLTTVGPVQGMAEEPTVVITATGTIDEASLSVAFQCQAVRSEPTTVSTRLTCALTGGAAESIQSAAFGPAATAEDLVPFSGQWQVCATAEFHWLFDWREFEPICSELTRAEHEDPVPGVAPVGVAPGMAVVGLDGVEPLAEGDVLARMSMEGVSRAEAEKRFHVDRAAGIFQKTVAARWPATFGGLWIDVDNYGVVVAFTHGADQIRPTLRLEFPYPETLRAETVDRSLAELVATQKRMMIDRQALQLGLVPPDMPDEMAQTQGHWNLDIDVPGNRVVVELAQMSPQLRQQFRDRYDSTLLVQTGSAHQGCSPPSCRHDGIGGIRYQIGESTYWEDEHCSTGFAVHNPADGNQYLTGSGHCHNRNSDYKHRWHEGSRYGKTYTWHVGGNKDYEAIRRENSEWNNLNRVYVQDEDPRSITGWVSIEDTAVGTLLGKSGATNDPQYTSRGYVKSRNYSPYVDANDTQYSGLVRTDMCSAKGASGGPVFRNKNAYGNVIGHYSGGEKPTHECRDLNGNWTSNSTERGKMYYGGIEHILDHLKQFGIELMTSSPPPPPPPPPSPQPPPPTCTVGNPLYPGDLDVWGQPCIVPAMVPSNVR